MVASAALKVLRRRLWYMGPGTVVLSLCSGHVADHVKSEMSERLLNISGPNTLEIGTNKAVVRDDEYLCAWWIW